MGQACTPPEFPDFPTPAYEDEPAFSYLDCSVNNVSQKKLNVNEEFLFQHDGHLKSLDQPFAIQLHQAAHELERAMIAVYLRENQPSIPDTPVDKDLWSRQPSRRESRKGRGRGTIFPLVN